MLTKKCLMVSAMLWLATLSQLAQAQEIVLITEFMAANRTGLKDQDGQASDWIEIFNGGTNSLNLEGWHLTDDANDLTKWSFPATNLNPNSYLIVFASGNDRRIIGQPLHTSFQLSAGGEYLALVKPDGTNVASAYAPVFPPQFNDISFGMSTVTDPALLITTNAPVRVYVPTNDALVTSWVNLDFDDSAWTAGTNGLGYDNNASEPGQTGSSPYASLIKTDVRAAMSNVNSSAYLRIPFQVANPGEADALVLRMKYDDGFVAYLNGTEVLRRNAPSAANAGQVANFTTDFSGTQGLNNWYYGYYNATTDTNSLYNTTDLTLFANNYWTGTAWDLTASGAPWTTIDPQVSHPNGNNSGNIHWTVARWVSEANGSVTVTINLRKQNTGGGNGTTGKLFVNGVEKFTYAIAATDGVGITTNLTITGVNVGDYFDFALTPRGPDGADGDSNDGTYFYFTVDQLPGADLTWNSAATGLHLDTQAVAFEDFDISSFARLLVPGTNVLAIHGLNVTVTNVDFLLLAEMQMRTLLLNNERLRYFLSPTPGQLNTFGTASLGARIFDVAHTPFEPLDTDNLVITARITPTLDVVTNVTLTYRVMFGAETSVAMRDDGLAGDQTANDGLFTAIIPPSLSTTGQMVRWFVSATDASGIASRWPLYENTTTSPKYLGTVIADPGLTSNLPILHWFVESPSAANTDAGTRASFYFNRQFFDNIGVTLHGQSSSGFPKKSYNFNLNSSYKVEVTSDLPKMSDFALLSTWADRTYVRNSLASDTYIMSGLPAHFTFPLRVHQNGAYFSLANFMEQGNNEYLDRINYDPQGALYKIYNTITTVSGNEKKTRKWDTTADFQALVTAVNSTDANTYLNFIYDNVNLPSVANFIATKAIASDHDCCHKNYYLYRDSDGTGEWFHLPWDMDLSFGHKWTAAPQGQYFDDTITTNVGPYVGGNSILLGRVLGDATLKSLVARRLRTLMDQIQQPPGTPPQSDRLRDLITWHTERVRAEAALDRAKWGIATWVAPTYGPANPTSSFDVELTRTKDFFLDGYRRYLFLANTANGQIPAAQAAFTSIRFGAVEVNPASANQQQEYIELLNTNNFAAEISGWRLAGGVSFTFDPGTVIPAGGKLYVSPNVAAFRARTTGPRAGQRLIVVGPYQGQLSTRGENLSLLAADGALVNSLQTTNTASAAQQFLRVTEIMYYPPTRTGDTNDVDQYEYLELRNISTNTALNLNGVHFVTGITFNFTGSAITNLAPGERVLVVKNPALFAARYGASLPVAGTYLGNLDNSGETLRLEDASNEKILEFAYNDAWYPITDGFGYALTIVDDTAHWSTWDQKQSWRAGGQLDGTPGQSDLTPPVILPVLVNEVLSRPTPTNLDWVELYNPNPVDVNVGGWFISDDFRTPKKFRIPDGTTIASNSFLVFTENDFNLPGASNAFAFGAKGDSVYLFSGDAATNLTGYFHGFDFGAAAAGVSFGRYTLLTGEDHFLAQLTNSPGATNAGPAVGPVVIHEIMYHPPDLVLYNLPYDNQRDEFIELRNISTNTILLNDPAQPNSAWRLRDAVGFAFPTNTALPPDGYLLVVSFDPQAEPASLSQFLARYNLPANTPIFGPYDGKLNNDNNSVELVRLDLFEDGLTDEVLMDRVRYQDGSPWACGSDATGNSLQRLQPATYGNDPFLWIAKSPSPAAPNPTQVVGLASIVAQPADQWVTTNSSVRLAVEACASGTLFYQWQRDGAPISGATNSTLLLNNVTINDSGYYTVILSNFSGALTSAPALVAVQTPPVITAQPQTQTVPGFTPVTLAVTAEPTPPFRYQWRFGIPGTDIPGATNATLFLPSVVKANQGTYSVLVWNAAGQVLSSNATLTVNVPARVLVPPPNLTTTNGLTPTFAPTIAGDPPLAYQWYFNSAPLANATNATLTLSSVQASNAGPYYLVVSNLFGMDTSAVAQLTVLIKPKFLTNPPIQVLTIGEDLRFSATLEGTPPFTYIWKRSGTPLATNYSSAFTDEFAIPRALLPNGGLYFVTAANPAHGGQNSGFAFVAVVAPPADRQVLAGSNVTLRADVVTSGSITYQWQFGGTNVPGGTTTSLALTGVQADRAGTYRLMVSNAPTQVRWYDSQLTVQTVATAPALTQQPTNLTVPVLENALFLAAASGTEPLTYQWQFNGTNLAGATNRYLGLTNAVLSQAGPYQLVVSNSLGVVTSQVANLNFEGVNADTDGDGIPDAWEAANGLVVGVNDTLLDSDSDGLSNFQEYLTGTSPTNAASVLKLESPVALAGNGELTLRFNAVSNRSYVIEYRTVVTGQPWKTLLNLNPASSNRWVELTNSFGTNQLQFFRLGTTP